MSTPVRSRRRPWWAGNAVLAAAVLVLLGSLGGLTAVWVASRPGPQPPVRVLHIPPRPQVGVAIDRHHRPARRAA